MLVVSLPLASLAGATRELLHEDYRGALVGSVVILLLTGFFVWPAIWWQRRLRTVPPRTESHRRPKPWSTQ